MIHDDEICQEYMQVAALVCMDLDILLDIAENDSLTAEQLVKQIKLMHADKEKAINNPKDREDRYRAMGFVFGAAAAGLVQCTKIGA